MCQCEAPHALRASPIQGYRNAVMESGMAIRNFIGLLATTRGGETGPVVPVDTSPFS